MCLACSGPSSCSFRLPGSQKSTQKAAMCFFHVTIFRKIFYIQRCAESPFMRDISGNIFFKVHDSLAKRWFFGTKHPSKSQWNECQILVDISVWLKHESLENRNMAAETTQCKWIWSDSFYDLKGKNAIYIFAEYDMKPVHFHTVSSFDSKSLKNNCIRM